MQSGPVKTLFIINPILEKKSGKNIPGLITEHLNSERFDSTVLYSEYPGHAAILARLNAGNYQLIVAGGGDGTINQVARYLVNSETVLGILPLGSGKGLARSLNIPLNFVDAINTINNLHLARIDTGLIGTQRFFNVAGIGFDAEVAHAFAGSGKRGFLSYAKYVAKMLPGYSPVSASITTEDQTISGKFFIISIANSSQWGYGAHISPASQPDNGFLDICLIKDFPKILSPELLFRLYSKTIHRSRYVDIIRVKKAGISPHISFKGHMDGEPAEFAVPLNISIEPGSLKLVCPG